MDRRQFIQRLVSGAGLILVRCGRDSPLADRYFTSSVVMGHDHSVFIPESAWLQPPQSGITLITTTNLSHSHTVLLSYKQLVAIGQGDAVRVDSSPNGHQHPFILTLRETY